MPYPTYPLGLSQLPEAVRLKAQSLGQAGEHWLAMLNPTITDLAIYWRFTPGKVLYGGSESLTLAVTLADGAAAVVKLGLPGLCDCQNEANVLRLANGRGYVQLLAHSAEHNALLLEGLGVNLARQNLPVQRQIELICQALHEAWLPLEHDHGLLTGRDKAQALPT
ncbi:MAG: aminoglycoside phosphotransferase family protein [Caldilineaceae bacterium]